MAEQVARAVQTKLELQVRVARAAPVALDTPARTVPRLLLQWLALPAATAVPVERAERPRQARPVLAERAALRVQVATAVRASLAQVRAVRTAEMPATVAQEVLAALQQRELQVAVAPVAQAHQVAMVALAVPAEPRAHLVREQEATLVTAVTVE